MQERKRERGKSVIARVFVGSGVTIGGGMSDGVGCCVWSVGRCCVKMFDVVSKDCLMGGGEGRMGLFRSKKRRE